MVESGFAFRDARDRGMPIYRADAGDFAQLGDLYDHLRENFSGIGLDFYPHGGGKVILAHGRQSLADGAALRARLQALSNEPRHAYVASLDGRHLAVVVNYAQRSARRDGPSFDRDIDGTYHRQPPRHSGIMETETDKIKSVEIAEDVYPVKDKLGIHGWQWRQETELLPERDSPANLCDLLALKLGRFARGLTLS